MDKSVLVETPETVDDMRVAQLYAIMDGVTTQRFHTVRTIQRNTVGHHSAGVALLCYMLTNNNPSKQLLMAALTHDIGEQWTGDMPAPAKRAMGIRESFGEFEEQALNTIGLSFPLDARDSVVLKLADALDGMLFCITERQLGNRAIGHVYANFNRYVWQLNPDEDQQLIVRSVNAMWETG